MQARAADARVWSGIPAGVLSGLEAAGVEPVAVDARMPGADVAARALRVSPVRQRTNPLFAHADGLSAVARLRAAGPLDGVVQIGSGYTLPSRFPVVTYEDMTVVQALAQPDPRYASLSERGGRRWRRRQEQIYSRSVACCAASSWVANSIRADYGVGAERVHVVGFGADVEPRRGVRDWSVPRFIFIGNDWARKRGDAVVEAFAKVRERHPEASLDLVGGHPEISAPGVRGHGFLPLGSSEARDRIEDLLARATCMVIPSEYEPFGIAYVEAAAAGIPSIGTAVGGASDAIGDGGAVVDPADSDALCRAMLDLAEPATASALGEIAQARAPLFTWRAVAERLIRALRPPGIDISTLARFLDADTGAASVHRPR
jgi:glycosyltransferase involved in cell wall biosynthesis